MAQCGTKTFAEQQGIEPTVVVDADLRRKLRDAFWEGMDHADGYVRKMLGSSILEDLTWIDEAAMFYPDPAPERRVIRLQSDGQLARMVNPGQEPPVLETKMEGGLHWYPLHKVHPKDVLLVADLIRNPLEAPK